MIFSYDFNTVTLLFTIYGINQTASLGITADILTHLFTQNQAFPATLHRADSPLLRFSLCIFSRYPSLHTVSSMNTLFLPQSGSIGKTSTSRHLFRKPNRAAQNLSICSSLIISAMKSISNSAFLSITATSHTCFIPMP